MVLLHGASIIAFDRSWSMMTSSASKVFDSGKSVMKSMLIVWKGNAFVSLLEGIPVSWGCVGCVFIFIC